MKKLESDINALARPTAHSRCPLCGCVAAEPFLEFSHVPVFCNVLWDTAKSALEAPTGEIALSCCEVCGLVFNRAFDAELVRYAPGYENSLHFSHRFCQFADQLSRRLVADYDLFDGIAVEIGCGDAQFLRQMTQNGLRQGIGFDPSACVDDSSDDDLVTVIPAAFNGQALTTQFDILICRHVLEHIDNPRGWLEGVRRSIGDRTPICYFEVPNGQWIIESHNLWDVIYEHVTYWTPPSLRYLFESAGFSTVSLSSGFDRQFLMIESRPRKIDDLTSSVDSDEVAGIVDLCNAFFQQCDRLLQAWRELAASANSHGKTAVVWGAGSKGVSFVNALGTAAGKLRGVVDVNPRKRGKYIAGTGLPVLGPEDLRQIRPDIVYVMNAAYVDEIRNLLSTMALAPELVVVMKD